MKKLSRLLLFSFVIFPILGMKEDQLTSFSNLPDDAKRAVLLTYTQRLLYNPDEQQNLAQNSKIILQAIIPAQTYWTDENGEEQRAGLFSTAENIAILQDLEQAVSERTSTELPIPHTLLNKLGLDRKKVFQNRPSALDLYKEGKMRVHEDNQCSDILLLDNNYRANRLTTFYNFSKIPAAKSGKDIIEEVNVNYYDFRSLNVESLTFFKKLRFLKLGVMFDNGTRKNIIHTIPKYCLANLSNLEGLVISNADVKKVYKKAFTSPQRTQDNLKYITFSDCNFSTEDNIQFLTNIPSSVTVYWNNNQVNGNEISVRDLATRFPDVKLTAESYYDDDTTQTAAAWHNL